MTEADWLTSTDARPLLDFLRGNSTERKLRLFGVGCCRQFRGQANAVADALETAEQYADTGKTKAALKRARQGVKTIRHTIPNDDKTRFTEWVALWLTEVVASENASAGVGNEVIRLTSLGLIGPEVQTSLVKLLHCIFGNPFCPISTDPAWLTPAVLSLAQTIYDERTFERMPELANALEMADCTNAVILKHCREPGPHVRGCWALDLVLGKS